jgi:hypothetical protein
MRFLVPRINAVPRTSKPHKNTGIRKKTQAFWGGSKVWAARAKPVLPTKLHSELFTACRVGINRPVFYTNGLLPPFSRRLYNSLLAGGRIGFHSRSSGLQRIHQYRAVLQNAGASVIMEKTAH